MPSIGSTSSSAKALEDIKQYLRHLVEGGSEAWQQRERQIEATETRGE